jgi:hypothetical protein
MLQGAAAAASSRLAYLLASEKSLPVMIPLMGKALRASRSRTWLSPAMKVL